MKTRNGGVIFLVACTSARQVSGVDIHIGARKGAGALACLSPGQAIQLAHQLARAAWKAAGKKGPARGGKP